MTTTAQTIAPGMRHQYSGDQIPFPKTKPSELPPPPEPETQPTPIDEPNTQPAELPMVAREVWDGRKTECDQLCGGCHAQHFPDETQPVMADAEWVPSRKVQEGIARRDNHIEITLKTAGGADSEEAVEKLQNAISQRREELLKQLNQKNQPTRLQKEAQAHHSAWRRRVFGEMVEKVDTLTHDLALAKRDAHTWKVMAAIGWLIALATCSAIAFGGVL